MQERRERLADLYGQWAAEMLLIGLAMWFAWFWLAPENQTDRSIDTDLDCGTCEIVQYRNPTTDTPSYTEPSKWR